MNVWKPGLPTKAVIAFVYGVTYLSAVVVAATVFWSVGKAALPALLLIGSALGVWAASRIFVQISQHVVRIGYISPLVPQTFAVDASDILRARMFTKRAGSIDVPFLEIDLRHGRRQIPMGWFSQSQIRQMIACINVISSRTDPAT